MNNYYSSINFVHLGNGITIYRKDIEVNGDHPIVAHISADREITFYKDCDKYIGEKLKNYIRDYARSANPNISATQDQKVFKDLKPTIYVITGRDKEGKQFEPIYTTTPQHYNIWVGTLWKLVDGRRKLIRHLL